MRMQGGLRHQNPHMPGFLTWTPPIPKYSEGNVLSHRYQYYTHRYQHYINWTWQSWCDAFSRALWYCPQGCFPTHSRQVDWLSRHLQCTENMEWAPGVRCHSSHVRLRTFQDLQHFRAKTAVACSTNRFHANLVQRLTSSSALHSTFDTKSCTIFSQHIGIVRDTAGACTSAGVVWRVRHYINITQSIKDNGILWVLLHDIIVNWY